MHLYDQTTFECSRLITRHYSTSFSLGIATLAKEFRPSVYAIYGFVRYADEIVDTFEGHDKKALLLDFRADTYKAIQQRISLNPVLNSFQYVVNRYRIPHDLIEAFLHSMEMDLYEVKYNNHLYHEYIYGSAEVVGLMCLKVFCKGDEKQYNSLVENARSLGAAFQKVNFLRDMKSDYLDRGRIYFPGVDLKDFNGESKKLIEADISRDFDHALVGIKKLPNGSRFGVYVAYIYYRALFNKIKNLSPSGILKERIRIPNIQKFWLLLRGYCSYRLVGPV